MRTGISNNQIEVSGAHPHWLTINTTALATPGKAPPSFATNASRSYDNVVEGNVALAGTVSSMVGTRVQRSLHLTSARQWVLNFSSSLVFEGIAGHTHWSFTPDSATTQPPAMWLARDGAADGVVVVAAEKAVSGSVSLQVEQSAFLGGVL